MGAERGGAAAANGAEEGTFDPEGPMEAGPVDGGEEVEDGRVVGAGLDGKGALARGGDGAVEGEMFCDAVVPRHAAYASGGEDDGVEVGPLGFAEAGVDVAAEVDDAGVGATGANLDGAAAGRSADGRVGREVGEREVVAGDEDIAGIVTDGDSGDGEARRLVGWEILGGVDGGVDFTAVEGVLKGRSEDAATANQREGGGLVEVALGADDDRFDSKAGVTRPKEVSDDVGLGEREGAAAGTEAKTVGERR